MKKHGTDKDEPASFVRRTSTNTRMFIIYFFTFLIIVDLYMVFNNAFLLIKKYHYQF